MEQEDTLKELQQRLRAFRDARNWNQFHRPKDLAASISIEANELLELFLWIDQDAQDAVVNDRRDAVEHELADVLIQCLNFANATGLDPARAVQKKIAANEAKYPIDKSKGTATKYTEL